MITEKTIVVSENKLYSLKQYRKKGYLRQYVEVNLSIDNGRSWEPIKLQLSLISKLKMLFIEAWPPSKILDFCYRNEGLEIEFEDFLEPNQKPIMPFNLDRESRWLARLNNGKSDWQLVRLNVLDKGSL
jgi:hypothetical protein